MFDFLKKKLKESIDVIQSTFWTKEKEEEADKQNKGILSHKITEKDVDEVYGGIKQALLENNVALSVLDAIHSDLKKDLLGKDVSMLGYKKDIENAIKSALSSVLMSYPEEKFLQEVRQRKPYKIMFVGVNGVGKTTTIAKIANLLLKNNLKVVVAASDTFRAASIEQLEIHCKNLGVDLIKHKYGADPAAVAFDAVKHAVNTSADVVLIDTAGRSDLNKDLLDELKKVKRVNKPDITIFVGDALTGNDLVKQAEIFNKEIGIDYSIVSKADVDKKGGAVLSLAYVTKKPILFLGTGQRYEDLVSLNVDKTVDFLFSS
ncbi:MAG: signal recognition particle-docking protein FtsY [Nanoarchaeota archaeon]|nr:signal recognition particle-docking protein FtsY [Nanoarchaeota archaeon]